MIYQSKMEERGIVTFPEFTGERVYMIPFLQSEGLPEYLRRWQSTVDAMLRGVQTDKPIYLMIDQSFVREGTPQRRPGVHIDGYWVDGSHGSLGHGSNQLPVTHSPQPGHSSIVRVPLHGPYPSDDSAIGDLIGPGKSHMSGDVSWERASFSEPEAIILSSNVSASRGFTGLFEGPVREGGACEHVDVSALRAVELQANRAYVGNVTFLHESLPVKEDCLRTLVRLNVPGYKF